ncbi:MULTISPECIES: acyl-CoA dehydrogenase family protein [unclassified Archaeoglobus]|jgi:alkylation response protein AidB-like acyl-CoA dehydrogenase|uniref:acyl-CoA dehydrogenase family protein n=1 Tax=unclassified Archaeoglobus TaxID=2643606 RepID=UPI0025B9A188|nr:MULTISPECIES: acyl-CoA dehydrogenase family protein [unclassified Archaeoglobus]
MNFELTQEQKDIKNAAREFATNEFTKEKAEEYDRKEEFPFDLWKKSCELGFIGVHFPEEYGGAGMGILENTLIVEEFCRADSTIGSAVILSDFSSEVVMRFGDEEQKKEVLPKVAGGEAITAGCYTEPEAGSDLTAIKTRAEKDGDEWVINGSKTFITNGNIADYYIVLAVTNPDAQPRYRGFSTFLVKKDTPGLSTNKISGKLGIRASPTAEVVFKDVRVDESAVIGELNRGFYQVLEFFDESRIEIAAQALGIAQGAFDRIINYVKQRKQFGQPIGAFQALQHRIADLRTQLEAARLLIYKAAWNYDQGRIDPGLTSMAKYYAGKLAVKICDEAVQMHGGYGYIAEYEVERFFRDAKITEIYEGTKEVQLNTIARDILGKFR